MSGKLVAVLWITVIADVGVTDTVHWVEDATDRPAEDGVVVTVICEDGVVVTVNCELGVTEAVICDVGVVETVHWDDGTTLMNWLISVEVLVIRPMVIAEDGTLVTVICELGVVVTLTTELGVVVTLTTDDGVVVTVHWLLGTTELNWLISVDVLVISPIVSPEVGVTETVHCEDGVTVAVICDVGVTDTIHWLVGMTEAEPIIRVLEVLAVHTGAAEVISVTVPVSPTAILTR